MKLLTSPVEAVKEAKKEKNTGKTVGMLVISAILFVASFAIFQLRTISLQTSTTFFVGIFIGILVLGLFYGFVTKLVMGILGGKGRYFEGLTSITYSIFPVSVGTIISAILLYILTYISAGASFEVIGISSMITMFISTLVFMVFLSIGMATFYKSLVELFEVEMVVALVGAGILTGTLILSMYALGTLGLIGFLTPPIPIK